MNKSDNFKNITIGKIGEDAACEYLVNNGYKILKRNERSKFGEIDIIAKAKNRTLVFVEVKALTGAVEGPDGLMPEDHLTATKLKRLGRAAKYFLAQNEDLFDERKGWRIDLVAIDFLLGKEPAIRHYENI